MYWSRECSPRHKDLYSWNNCLEQSRWAGCRHKSHLLLQICLGSSCSLKMCRCCKTPISVCNWCSFLIQSPQKASQARKNICCFCQLYSCANIADKSYQSICCIALHTIGCNSNTRKCFRLCREISYWNSLNSGFHRNQRRKVQIGLCKIHILLGWSWRSWQLDICNEFYYTLLSHSGSFQ